MAKYLSEYINNLSRSLSEKDSGSVLSGLEEKTEKLEKYMDMVLTRNMSVNLTAITDPEEFEIKNIIDSLSCIGSSEYASGRTVIDIGTGAGLPGIPLAVMSPDKEFLLMDSLAKRIRIVQEIADELNLTNVKTVHGRAEDLARDAGYREKFDICVSRAVSRLPVLCEYCLPFVRKGGVFISYKGSSYIEEIRESSNALGILGGKLIRTDEECMKEFGLSHPLIYIAKKKNTPDIYPRKAGTPQKKPL